MSKVLKSILILCHIGGGFAGLSYVITIFKFNQPAINLVLISIFGLIYLFGIVGGYFLVWKESIGIKLSLIYHVLQIPILYAQPPVYLLHSGFALDFTVLKGNIIFQWYTGTVFHIGLNQPPSGFGVNIFALVIVIILTNKLINRTSASTLSLATPRSG